MPLIEKIRSYLKQSLDYLFLSCFKPSKCPQIEQVIVIDDYMSKV